MSSLQQQLQQYKSAYQQLQNSFNNNLNVIKQLQQENSQMQNHIQEMGHKYDEEYQRMVYEKEEESRKKMDEMEMQFGREIQLVKKEYQDLINGIAEENQKKREEMVVKIAKKHKLQIQSVKASVMRQLQSKQSQIKKHTTRVKSLQQSLTLTQTKLNTSNLQILSLQSQLQQLNRQLQQSQSFSVNYQQQLQSLKNQNTSWQSILKNRIKELQQQKALIEEQAAEMKFVNKEKIKKLTQEHNRKITLLEESHQVKMNQTLGQVRQIKFKYEAIRQENTQANLELQKAKRQLAQVRKLLEQERFRNNTNQGSILTVKEKQFEIKSLSEQVKRLKGELSSIQQDKLQLKEQNEKLNYQRENAEKALERLKVQLLNKTREAQETKKEMQKMKYKNQVNSLNNNQTNSLNENGNNVKGLSAYDKKDAIKGENTGNNNGVVDYSRCFTQDMGPIDQNYFMMHNSSNMMKSPVHMNNEQSQLLNIQQSYQKSPKNNNQQVPLLLKRIGQLQLQIQEYKSTIKAIKQEMQRTTLMINEKLQLKDKEIRLGKDQNMLLREKLNDKEEYTMRIKEENRKIKEELENAKTNLISSIESKQLKQQNEKLKSQVDRLGKDLQATKQEAQLLTRQRQMLQEIADQLKSQVNFYKQELQCYQQQHQQYTIQQQSISQIPNMKSSLNNSSTSNNANPFNPSTSNPFKHHKQQSSDLPRLLNNLSNNYSHNTPSPAVSPQNINQQRTILNKKPFGAVHQNPRIPLPNNENNKRLSNEKSQNQRKHSKSPQHYDRTTSKNIATNPENKQKQKKKKKLHELIKQKNKLEAQGGFVIGQKATIMKRPEEERPQHVGTASQKEIYHRIEQKSKSKQRQQSLSRQRPISKLKLHPEPIVNHQKSYENQKQHNSSIPIISYNRPQQDLSYHPNQHQDQSQLAERIQLINKFRNQMIKSNDSLGQFDHLQNVSLTYWQQQ